MRLWLARWGCLGKHVYWRMGMMFPMLFTQYTSNEEVYEERELSNWKLGLVSVVVIGVSVWSFFL